VLSEGSSAVPIKHPGLTSIKNTCTNTAVNAERYSSNKSRYKQVFKTCYASSQNIPQHITKLFKHSLKALKHKPDTDVSKRDISRCRAFNPLMIFDIYQKKKPQGYAPRGSKNFIKNKSMQINADQSRSANSASALV
jgi:hypothetical protein